MKKFLEEYGMTVVYVTIAIMLFAIIGMFTYNNGSFQEAVPDGKDETAAKIQVSEKSGPTLEIRSGRVRLESEFNPLDYVIKAEDSSGKNILENVRCSGAEDVDTSKEGIYTVQYTLMDDDNLVVRKEASFLVD